MHATAQSGGHSPKPINSPTSTSQLNPGSDNVQSAASLPSQAKGKKRERADQGYESIKRECFSKTDDGDSGQFKPESILKFEISKMTENGGLVDSEGVWKLVQLMQPDRAERKMELVCRSMLAGVIVATEKFDCLSRFLQLRGLPVLHEWLQDVHEGRISVDSTKDDDKSQEEFLLVLLRALDKLPVNLHALLMCNIGKSVNYLCSHKNFEIQKKAGSLVDTWKKRVLVEMNLIDGKSGSMQAVSKTDDMADGFDHRQPSSSSSVGIGSSNTQLSSSCWNYSECTSSLGNSSSHKQNSGSTIRPSEPRKLQLRFLNKLSLPVLTGKHIEGEDGTSIKVGLFDADGEEVKFGPEASAEVEIVVLREDQNGDEGHDWTPEEFNLKIERKRKRNRSLLTGKAFLNLKEGIGLVDKISFTNISDWMSKRPFRLGARIVDNFNGTTVREAKSEPFTLEDCRSKLYEKHYPPSLSDEVWRLKNIDKRGPLVKRLRDGNIKTVREFLIEYFINHQRLQYILGTGMSDKKLDDTVEHALTCELNDRYLYHSPDSQQKIGVVFNAVGQVVGVLCEYQYVPVNNLSETVKADAQKSVVSAFKHSEEVVPYDENYLLRCSSHLPNALAPSNSPRLQGHSVPDVGTSHVIVGISSNNTFGTSHTIVGYDPTQPSTSSAGFISSNNPVGTSDRVAGYDPMQPSTSSPIILPFNNSIETSPRIAAYDPMQPRTSYLRIVPPNNSIETFPRIAGYDSVQPSTSSPRILPSNNSIGTSLRIAAYDPTQHADGQNAENGFLLVGAQEEYLASPIVAQLMAFKKKDEDGLVIVEEKNYAEAEESKGAARTTLQLQSGKDKLPELQMPSFSMDWTQDTFWSQLRSPWLDNLTPYADVLNF